MSKIEKLLLMVSASSCIAAIGLAVRYYASNSAKTTKALETDGTLQNAAATPAKITRAPANVVVQKVEVITLNEKNSVALDTAFDDNSVANIMRQLQVLSDKASKSSTLYLVLNSPGGSVEAGLKLIGFAKGLPQKVKTITIFAASMGFQTVQQLDERLILPNGTLMSHPVSFGVEGATPYQVIARYKWIISIADSMDQVAARRMNMDFNAYQNMIHDEYWVFGANAVQAQAADRMVFAKCGEYASKSKWTKVETMFGTFDVELNSCPLIPGFISVVAPKGATKEALDYVRLMLTERNKFTKEYIVTNKYLNFQK